MVSLCMSTYLEEGGEGHFILPLRLRVMDGQHLSGRLRLSLGLINMGKTH